jgi:hypothetical protein
VVNIEKIRMQVSCPYCGYRMPIFYDKMAVSAGIFARCKGKSCKREFEIKINQDK